MSSVYTVAAADAACLDTDPDAFFRSDRESEPAARNRAAMIAATDCAHCPLIEACHELAEHYRAEGLWGGRWRTRDTVRGGFRVENLLTTFTSSPSSTVRAA